MDEIVDRVVSETGAERAAVAKGLAIIVNFLAREAPPEKVGAMIDKLPGARDLIGKGGTSRGLFGVFNELAGAGLGMGEVQTLARTFLAEARARLGADEVNAVVASIPGLGQFV